MGCIHVYYEAKQDYKTIMCYGMKRLMAICGIHKRWIVILNLAQWKTFDTIDWLLLLPVVHRRRKTNAELD
jgi:hypothetical protein